MSYLAFSSGSCVPVRLYAQTGSLRNQLATYLFLQQIEDEVNEQCDRAEEEAQDDG